MKKKLEDYLHLYLQAKNEDGSPLKLAIRHGDKHFQHRSYLQEIENGTVRCGGTSFPFTKRVKFEEVKPFLRSLSSMTMEESNDIFKNADKNYIPDYWEVDANEFKPTEFLLMLNMGFDLFGLIESGLALDKEVSKQ